MTEKEKKNILKVCIKSLENTLITSGAIDRVATKAAKDIESLCDKKPDKK